MTRIWKHGAAALLAGLALTLAAPPAEAAVTVNGTELGPAQAWVEEGTTYVFLRDYAGPAGYDLAWEGDRAVLRGGGLTVEAPFGAPYILANGCPIRVEEGVRVRDGRTYLPLRALARAAGAEARWDPETGDISLDLRGVRPIAAPSGEAEDLYWLSRIISAESRGEPYEGQIAVGNVVLNRVAHPGYPGTVKEVVFDIRGAVQFEPVANGTVYDEPAESSLRAARECLAGAQSAVGDSLFFFAPALSPGTWIVENCEYVTTIGGHRFYK